MEFLIGWLIEDVVINLCLEDVVVVVMELFGQFYDCIVVVELDVVFGNGGLGWLVVCFMDLLVMFFILVYGYGIWYEYGLFEQYFKDGCQMEMVEIWLM